MIVTQSKFISVWYQKTSGWFCIFYGCFSEQRLWHYEYSMLIGLYLCFRLAMNHFGLENEVNSVIRMDAPFARGPQMRWQRKMADSLNLSKSDSTINCSLNQSSSGSSKTPMKPINNSVLSEKDGGRNSNGSSKTPGKTPHKTSKTPSELK